MVWSDVDMLKFQCSPFIKCINIISSKGITWLFCIVFNVVAISQMRHKGEILLTLWSMNYINH